MYVLCGVLQKQLAALKALVIQMEAELVLVVNAPEPPELREERRVQALICCCCHATPSRVC